MTLCKLQPCPTGKAAAFACLLGVTACAGPIGPIIGDWRGQDITQSLDQRTEVEIILDGPPGARSGTYHYASLTQGAELDIGNRRLDWTDRWRAQPLAVDGRQMQIVHLDNLAGPHIDDFVLTPDNILVPLPDPLRPDLSGAAFHVALYPVSPTSFGYGRP